MAKSPADSTTSTAAETTFGLRTIIHSLHQDCTKTVLVSVESRHNEINAASYGLSRDLDAWTKVLAGHPENALYITASTEYVLAQLNNAQGQYRNAFKGLRLVLELILQGAYLSVNLVTLTEWLGSQADTSWQAILDENKGVFAVRYCRAFFPDMAEHAPALKTLAETLYREMSECIHGNVPNKIPLPQKIAFDEPTFTLWHRKASTLRLIVNFVFVVRYFRALNAEQLTKISPIISEQLGHFEPVRLALGGPASS